MKKTTQKTANLTGAKMKFNRGFWLYVRRTAFNPSPDTIVYVNSLADGRIQATTIKPTGESSLSTVNKNLEFKIPAKLVESLGLQSGQFYSVDEDTTNALTLKPLPEYGSLRKRIETSKREYKHEHANSAAVVTA